MQSQANALTQLSTIFGLINQQCFICTAIGVILFLAKMAQ